MAEPTYLLSWIGCTAFVLVGVKAALDLYRDHIKESPEPARTYATIAAMTALEKRTADSIEEIKAGIKTIIADQHREHQEEMAKVDHDLDKLNSERRKDVQDIHRKIDAVAVAQSATSAQTEMIHQRVESIGNKLDRLLERSAKNS